MMQSPVESSSSGQSEEEEEEAAIGDCWECGSRIVTDVKITHRCTINRMKTHGDIEPKRLCTMHMVQMRS